LLPASLANAVLIQYFVRFIVLMWYCRYQDPGSSRDERFAQAVVTYAAFIAAPLEFADTLITLKQQSNNTESTIAEVDSDNKPKVVDAKSINPTLGEFTSTLVVSVF
jgi:hypothetical protein